ncbi:MAG: N-6 DNA methylase [Gemmatimonadales bacterium]|jgi:predicted type IV restriction endonuclease
MTAPKEVSALIQRFREQGDSYRSARYNETQLRREFVDPLFKALGWDVDNEQGYAEAYKDVIHEDAIKVGGLTKAPDYCFRIGGVRKFFVEAKKPSIDIKGDPHPAFQLRRYAWSAKLPLSVLTDFEELAVYDCRLRPSPTDRAPVARVLYLTYEDYEKQWADLLGIFGRDAILKGGFDRFVESKGAKRGTAEVDAAFLADIEAWRDMLAKHLALRNFDLTANELNFAVQQTIDRIIFLRICEDRGVEPYGRLQALLNAERVYRRLCELFQQADDRYNSGLFHFRTERGRNQPPDDLSLRLVLEDKPLKEIIASLYYPDSPYEFSVLPADILGQVYEQFLGRVIRLTPGHRAVVEDKPEVKKAGGVYYTPTYVVDFIVDHTLAKILAGKSPRHLGRLRIVDPACGSGSFLIVAYQRLLDWHRDWYVDDGPAKHRRVLYQGPGGAWRLTTAEKRRILLNNVFGVDIDQQAVEVTKLSLLLKVLEGESQDTIDSQLRLLHERALPDLESNVLCGNSLVEPDFPESTQLEFLSEKRTLEENAFDWTKGFASIMAEGGFDVIIGNPPWGASFDDAERDYLRRKYPRAVARMTDSYLYFIERSLQLTKPRGRVGFVVPSTLLNQVDARPVRERLLERGLSVLVNVGRGVFGPKVLNTSTVFVTDGTGARRQLLLGDVSALHPSERPPAMSQLEPTEWVSWRSTVEADTHRTFFTGSRAASALLQRLQSSFPALEELIDGEIQRGVTPDVVAAHVLTRSEAKRSGIERALLKPGISGSKIRRYSTCGSDQFVLYTSRDIDIRKFPKAEKHLAKYRVENTCPEVRERRHPWWMLHRPRNPSIFKSPKIIGLTTTKTIELVYDHDGDLYVTDAMYVFRPRSGVDPLVLMAVMQSKAFLFLYRAANEGESRVIPQVKASKLASLPVPALSSKDLRVREVRELVNRLLELNEQLSRTRLEHEKTAFVRQIEAVEAGVDALANEMYGLDKTDVQMIESAV